MNNPFSKNPFGNLLSTTPDVIKNIILINGLMLLATFGFEQFMINNFSLFYIESPLFKPIQLLSHMFMHGGFMHFFFNMYVVWMFGRVLENIWGGKKFFLYYMVSGFGAMILHTFVLWVQMQTIESGMDPMILESVKSNFNYDSALSMRNSYKIFSNAPEWSRIMLVPTLGASGAVYGVLLAFAVMFPDTVLQLIFPPIALKARWFVLILIGIELFLGFSNANSGIAHFAHLGGALFGWLLIMYWKKKGKLFSKQ